MSIQFDGDRAVFAKAFVAAQKATEAVHKANTNPAFKSKYADLAAVVEAVVPALNAAGVAVLQGPEFDGEMVTVETMLIHESGASCSSRMSIRPAKLDAQGVGSAVTYARRYALLAITGAAPIDDDGAAASGPREEAPKKQIAPTIHPEGRDWWKCSGPGLTANDAKKQKLDILHDEMISEIRALTSSTEWTAWCQQHTPRISEMPQSWRVMLRQEAELSAKELGMDLNAREREAA